MSDEGRTLERLNEAWELLEVILAEESIAWTKDNYEDWGSCIFCGNECEDWHSENCPWDRADKLVYGDSDE